MDGVNGTLPVRSNKLARQNLIPTGVWLTLLLILGAAFWRSEGSAATPTDDHAVVHEELRARRLVLVDDAGRERIELGVMDDGQPRLILRDEGTGARALIGVGGQGWPFVALVGANGDILLDMGLMDKKHPTVVLRDPGGQRRLGMLAGSDGTVGMLMFDRSGKKRLELSLGDDGQPQVTLNDKQGRIRACLMVDDKGGSAVDLFDHNGKNRIVVQVAAQGEGDMVILGPDGKPVWSARSSSDRQ